MPICISRAFFSFSRVTTGPKTRRYVKTFFGCGPANKLVQHLRTSSAPVDSDLSISDSFICFLLQFFEEDPMLLPHPADELSLTLEQPADEAFPSYHIKFGHMKTN
ncbi:unnamed protein product [Sphagnum jensenii]|uniref:Uncharacterized protein n=1 Tax=Sphagnum jensenii TaxID=128206 RepID=A0ABP1AXV1_9BRYO